MRTARTEAGRPAAQQVGLLRFRRRAFAEGGGDDLGGKLAGGRQMSGHPAAHLGIGSGGAMQHRLDHRLAVFKDDDRLAGRLEFAQGGFRHRILADLEQRLRAVAAKRLHHVVVGDAAGDNAQGTVGPILEFIEGGFLGQFGKTRLLCQVAGIIGAGDRRQQDEPPRIVLRQRQRLFRLHGSGDDVGAGMGQAGGQPQQHRRLQLFRQGERRRHHVIGFLLRRRLEHRHLRKAAVEPRILFVLRGMHRGIVGRHHHQAAMRPGDRRIHEAIGRHIQPDMLHADQRPLAGIGHAERRLHRGFLVACPLAGHSARYRFRRPLDVFGDFGRWRSGIGVATGDPGIKSPLGNRLVTQQKSCGHDEILPGFPASAPPGKRLSPKNRNKFKKPTQKLVRQPSSCNNQGRESAAGQPIGDMGWPAPIWTCPF